jgi:hypothetical protein
MKIKNLYRVNPNKYVCLLEPSMVLGLSDFSFRCWWDTLIILATQEAEIRRIAV